MTRNVDLPPFRSPTLIVCFASALPNICRLPAVFWRAEDQYTLPVADLSHRYRCYHRICFQEGCQIKGVDLCGSLTSTLRQAEAIAHIAVADRASIHHCIFIVTISTLP